MKMKKILLFLTLIIVFSSYSNAEIINNHFLDTNQELNTTFEVIFHDDTETVIEMTVDRYEGGVTLAGNYRWNMALCNVKGINSLNVQFEDAQGGFNNSIPIPANFDDLTFFGMPNTWCDKQNGEGYVLFNNGARNQLPERFRLIIPNNNNVTQLYKIFTGTGSDVNDGYISNGIEEQCLQLLVATSDNKPSKQNRSLWNQALIDEELSSSTKRGYVIDYSTCNTPLGNLENQPNRYMILTIPESIMDYGLLDSEYNTTFDSSEDVNITSITKFRTKFLNLTQLMSNDEEVNLNNLSYNELVDFEIRTWQNSTLPIINRSWNYSIDGEEIRHGSSGTFYICSTGGCNYSSIQTWESTEQTDITGTGAAIAIINESFTSSSLTISGWTTTQDDYILIKTEGEGRHDGYYNSSKHLFNITSGDGITVAENYVHLDGLQIRHATTSSSQAIYYNLDSASQEHNLTNSILFSPNLVSNKDGVDVRHDNHLYMANSVIEGFGKGGIFSSQSISNNELYIYVVSSVFYDNGDSCTLGTICGGIVSHNTVTGTSDQYINIFNTISADNGGGGDYSQNGLGIVIWNISNSIDSDGTIGTDADNFRYNISGVTVANTDQGAGNFVIFENTTNWDFRIQDLGNSNNKAQDSHTNATGYNNLAITPTDIIGSSRPQNTNYDIGIFEIIVSGASTCNPTSPLTSNYVWQCSDNCIESDIDAGGFNISFVGTGSITFTNISNYYERHNQCKFIVLNRKN